MAVQALHVVVANADVLATTLKRRSDHPTPATAAKYSAADDASRVYVAAAVDAEAAVAGATAAYDELVATLARATATAETAPASGSREPSIGPSSEFE